MPQEDDMTALSHEDRLNVGFSEEQGLEKTLYDYQIPIALTALGVLFLLN